MSLLKKWRFSHLTYHVPAADEQPNRMEEIARLKDEFELQSYFMKRIERFISAYGA